jgi:hypothetical protein
VAPAIASVSSRHSVRFDSNSTWLIVVLPAHVALVLPMGFYKVRGRRVVEAIWALVALRRWLNSR